MNNQNFSPNFTQTLKEDPDRIKFNWGYHQAANDFSRNREKAWDALNPHPLSNPYYQGYLSGWAAAKRGEYNFSNPDSTDAWYHAKAYGDV